MDGLTPEPGAVLMGRYRLERRLGSGGAGVVWRALDEVLERAVAIKLLHADLAHDTVAAARFRTEASSAARLTHPNAVTVYDIGREAGRDLLVMELVDGPTFTDLLGKGPLPPTAVAHLGSSLASALGMAHRRGLLHRDVKPGNVLLTVDGVPKIADFGIARALGQLGARLTAPGSVMGTARYLAPEQLLDGPLDGRVDVYALGLILHEALTAEPPWGGGTAVEIATRRLDGDLVAASSLREDVPPELDAVVQRATRLEADERFEDGAAFAAALTPLAGPDGERRLERLVRATAPEDGTPQPPRGGTVRAPAAPVRPPAAPARSRTAPPRPPAAAPAVPVTITTVDRTATAEPSSVRPPPASSSSAAEPTAPPPTQRRDPTVTDGSRRQRRGGQGRRRRRGRIRRMVAVLILLLVAGVGLLAVTDLDLPGIDRLTDVLEGADVRDLVDDVRDDLEDRFGG